jgi:hypothetical protein
MPNPRGRPPTVHVVLTPVERRTLTRWQRQSTLAWRVVRRGRLLLLLDQGLTLSAAARRVGLTWRHAARWRRRFVAEGLAGLRDRPAGRPRRGPP